MGLGGLIRSRQPAVEARLLLAYAGSTRFAATRWKQCRHRWWVLDYINHGQQQQRVGNGKPFIRAMGVAALYAPGRNYHERQITGVAIDESYIIFEPRGVTETLLRQLVGAKGWCHFRDPDHIVSASLRRAAELLFYRRPGFQLLAHGALLELLGVLVTAAPLSVSLRDVRADGGATGRAGLIESVERYITNHIAKSVNVADLARHTKMSVSAFAHAYRRLADESPYQTVRRLKLEAAKHLLLRDGLSVKECARRLGFSSEFHFSRLFKQLEGMPPKLYRQMLMEKKLGSPSSARTARTESPLDNPDE